MSDRELDRYLDRARREMFPKMKGAAFSITIYDDPNPKLCLELGAAILFDKPILVLVPRGRTVPLALRTIANEIVEDVDLKDPDCQERISAAIGRMQEAARFRGKGGQ